MGFIFFNLLSDTPDAILGGVSQGPTGKDTITARHWFPGNYKLLLSAYNPHYYYMDFSKTEGGLSPDRSR